MPVTIIPNILHFLWIGSPIPSRHADNIIEWATLNARYEKYLWVEDQMLWVAIEELKLAFKRIMPDFEGEAYRRSRPPGFKTDMFVSEEGRGVTAYFVSEAIPTFSIKVLCIESLRPVTLGCELSDYRRSREYLPIAAEIVRFWIIYAMGGIYIDVRYKHGGMPLNENIIAPLTMLAAEIEAPECSMISSSILASTAENNYLKMWSNNRETEISMLPLYAGERAHIVFIEPDRQVEERIWKVEDIYSFITGNLLMREPGTPTVQERLLDNELVEVEPEIEFNFEELNARFETLMAQVRMREEIPEPEPFIGPLEATPHDRRVMERDRKHNLMLGGVAKLLSFTAQGYANIRLRDGVTIEMQ